MLQIHLGVHNFQQIINDFKFSIQHIQIMTASPYIFSFFFFIYFYYFFEGGRKRNVNCLISHLHLPDTKHHRPRVASFRRVGTLHVRSIGTVIGKSSRGRDVIGVKGDGVRRRLSARQTVLDGRRIGVGAPAAPFFLHKSQAEK